MEKVKELQADYLSEFNQFLTSEIETNIQNKEFAQILNYSIQAGGKRIRPLFVLAVCKMLNHPIDQTVFKAAAAIECLHTYSLIHDDLPAMDNDDYRRGRLTSHKKFGEANAILAGDALLTLGLQWLAELPHHAGDIVAYVSQAIGPNGMVYGQYLDVLSETDQSIQDVAKIHHLKTSRLFQASLYTGLKLSEATADEISSTLRFGDAFGLAFQIFDDLDDAKQSTLEGHDDADKTTYVSLYGIEGAKAHLTHEIEKAQRALADIEGRDYLLDFLDYFDSEE
ncbi:polyprenyl synthetase family protein [Holzapfeliella sp. He02]|uniref:Polyprenyl synthetase family protein n=1 Tax=Holzapfeliella saturejae TaxID=3082953 RepID=A0ABU8SH81_9LACO